MALNSLVFSNFLHRPARTIASVIGIAIGVLLIVFTVGMANGSMRERANRESNIKAEIVFCRAGSVCVMGNSAFDLPISLAKEIETVEGVKAVEPIGQTMVDAEDTKVGQRMIDGVRFETYAPLVGIHLISGKVFTPGKREAIIDTAFQQQKNHKIGDKISMWQQEFTIVGTYEPAAAARIKVPLTTMQEMTGGEGKATGLLIKIKDGSDLETVLNAISKKFPDDRLILTKDLEALYMNAFPALGVFLNVIIGVAAAISALVILLTMYTTVTERTRQIGIMKSLGMSNGGIAWTITKEAILLSAVGIATGILLTAILRFFLSFFVTLNVDMDVSVIVLISIVGLIGGALGALYPAVRAANLDAVEALNYE
ncbi:MAG: ABC transporter permease [Pyrinomonadaceae bacterium]